jgi:hypothetical protein
MPDFPFSPITQDTDKQGYHYVETSPEWKVACQELPSFAELAWPDYATKVIEDSLDGEPVVIQLWKGWCQRFFGRNDFPGGIGAEVCVYRRMPGKLVPPKLPHLPGSFGDFLLGGLARVGADRLLWPDPSLQPEIEFDMIYPGTNQVFFSADPETTYWRNRWMRPDSYEVYRAARNHDVPLFATSFTLRFRIDGKFYSWD